MNKVYIGISGKAVTGGAETVRQLAVELSSKGVDVSIYIHDEYRNYENASNLQKYECNYVFDIENKKENILIAVESQTYILERFKNIRKSIIWLSLDYYFTGDLETRTLNTLKKYGLPTILKPLAVPLVKKKFGELGKRYEFEYKMDFHLYNCEYARLYLESRGVVPEEMMYLCGPIRDEYFASKRTEKEDIILYNPKKGKEFTQELIKGIEAEFAEVKVVAIENMTSYEIKELMGRSKIYIDFGEFPGPERLPREAVTCGCNLITGRNGAANNDVDVPILDEYKFNVSQDSISSIIVKLKEMCKNYEEDYHKFDKYRDKVADQKSEFKESINELVERINYEY